MSLLTFVCLAYLLSLFGIAIWMGQDAQPPKKHLMGHNLLGMPIYAPAPNYGPRSRATVNGYLGPGLGIIVFAPAAFWLSGYWENFYLRLAAIAVAAIMAVVGFGLVQLAWRTYCYDCRIDGKQPLAGAGTHVLLFMILGGLALAGTFRGFMTGDRLWPPFRDPVAAETPVSAHDNGRIDDEETLDGRGELTDTFARWRSWYLGTSREAQIALAVAALVLLVYCWLALRAMGRGLLLEYEENIDDIFNRWR